MNEMDKKNNQVVTLTVISLLNICKLPWLVDTHMADG